MLEHKNLSLSPFKVSWDLKNEVVFVFSLFQLGNTFLDLPRGAEWMIRGAYTPSVRVQTAPFGRCWFVNGCFMLFHNLNLCFFEPDSSRNHPWFLLAFDGGLARLPAPFSGIGAAQAGGRGDEQHRGLREHEANSEPVMDMTPLDLTLLETNIAPKNDGFQ